MEFIAVTSTDMSHIQTIRVNKSTDLEQVHSSFCHQSSWGDPTKRRSYSKYIVGYIVYTIQALTTLVLITNNIVLTKI